MILINNTPLNHLGVTQGANGRYYRIPFGSYLAGIFHDFETLTPMQHLPYLRHDNGSHSRATIRPQQAIDFRATEEWAVTSTKNVLIRQSSNNLGSFVRIREGDWDIYLVHTYKFARLGSLGRGGRIAHIAPQSHTGLAPHLHISMTNVATGSKSLQDYLRGEGYGSIRRGANMQVIRSTDGIAPGRVGKIIDPVVYTSGDGLPMFKLQFKDKVQNVKTKWLKWSNQPIN